MEKTHTQRGFGRYNFVDDYGAECSLQRSSSGTRIWLGCNDNRMHLNVEQVKALLPILQKFVETGDI